MNIDDLLDNKAASKKELGYDLIDDLIFFMNNDPEFYRKKYYPIMIKFNHYYKKGKKVSPRAFERIVQEAYDSYKDKFQVDGLEEDLNKEMCEKICRYIHEQETINCKNGDYDAS